MTGTFQRVVRTIEIRMDVAIRFTPGHYDAGMKGKIIVRSARAS